MDSNLTEIFFPKKNELNRSNMSLYNTNLFQMNIKDINLFCKYDIEIIPEIPRDAVSFRYRIFRYAKLELFHDFSCFLFKNLKILEFESIVSIGGKDFKICLINKTHIIENSPEAKILFKCLFNKLARNLHYVKFKNCWLDRYHSICLDKEIEIWPGLKNQITHYNNNIFISLNKIFKPFSNKSVLSLLNKLKKKHQNKLDFEREANSFFIDKHIITYYNNEKIYKIDKVNFVLSPTTKFMIKGVETNLIEYYDSKYNIKITDLTQPLLIIKNNKDSFLIPEISFLAGLTELKERSKKILSHIYTSNEKMGQISKLLENLKFHPKCMEDMNQWGMTIDGKPFQVEGVNLDSGKIISNQHSSPELNNWVVFKDDPFIYCEFLQNLEKMNAYEKFSIKPQFSIDVPSIKLKDWVDVIQQNWEASYQIIVLIITDKSLYPELKKLLFCRYPTPSQIILTDTLRNSNFNIYSRWERNKIDNSWNFNSN
jgi:hypothetical protein